MKLLLGNKSYINSVIDELDYKIITNEYGKPFFKSINTFFNKSHSKDLSIVIFNETLCGIDIEKSRKYNGLIAKKICSSGELELLNNSEKKDYLFTLLWVLKESYLKCIGVGLSFPMNQVSFVKDNVITLRKDSFSFEVIHYKDYIISICRKDY